MIDDKDKSSIKIYAALFSLLLLLIVIILLMYAVFERNEKSYERLDKAMQTYIQQIVYGNNAEEISQKAIQNINDLEKLISSKDEFSNIYKLNLYSGNKWVDINSTILEILSLCVEVSQKSFGAVDPTILPLLSIWGLDEDSPRLPTSTEIKNSLDYVDYRNLKLNMDVNRAKLLKEGAAVDLSCVMKGAACKIAIDTYALEHANCGIVEIGSSVGVYGVKSNRTDWRIAILDPFIDAENAEGVVVLKIKKGFISTASLRQHSFELNGQTYYSFINPKTGYPVETDLVSVSIWHENGVISDLLSTACFVMGRTKSQYLLDYYGAGAIFIDNNKKVYATDNIRNNLIIIDDDYKFLS